MNISYSVTLDAYVWHYSIVPHEYGIVIETRKVTPPKSSVESEVEWVEAKLAKLNSQDQQERFLAAQREYQEATNARMMEQIDRHGAG